MVILLGIAAQIHIPFSIFTTHTDMDKILSAPMKTFVTHVSEKYFTATTLSGVCDKKAKGMQHNYSFVGHSKEHSHIIGFPHRYQP